MSRSPRPMSRRSSNKSYRKGLKTRSINKPRISPNTGIRL